MTDGDWDLIGTPLQGPVKTHGRAACEGQKCCIHNPSDHHMKDWPLTFDMGMAAMGERHCPHGDRHPDPDSVRYMRGRYAAQTGTLEEETGWIGIHTCDGCCSPTKHIENTSKET